jgi:hypothetical protein
MRGRSAAKLGSIGVTNWSKLGNNFPLNCNGVLPSLGRFLPQTSRIASGLGGTGTGARSNWPYPFLGFDSNGQRRAQLGARRQLVL